MTDYLFQLGLSNVFLSFVLAIIAMLVGTISRRPHLLYLLWLIVLVKLVTPSVVTIPVVTIPEQIDRTIVSMQGHTQAISSISENKGDALLSAETWFAVLDNRKKELSLFWLLGSAVVLVVSLARVYRFNSLLRDESEVAPQELQAAAARIAKRFGLKKVPTIYTTSAHLSPMVWWIGGKVRVVIPAALHEHMDARQFRWILAHELAHLRRRDYLVRWVEWMACVGFWWNPVVLWARQNLRANEELCCDALVVSSLKLKPQTYADSLLKAVEFIACPVLSSPVMASEINSGGFLKRRFKMIVSGNLKQSNSRFWQICVLFFAVFVLPLGLACDRDIAVTDPAEQTEEAAMKTASEQDTKTGTKPKKDDGIDWRAVMAMAPEEWSNELKMQIVDAGYDLEEIAEKQAAIAEGKTSKEFDRDAVRMKIEAAVEAGKMTREQADMKYRAIREKMSQKDMDDGIDWETAKTTPPEEWSDELKARIEAAGYDLEQIAGRVSKYLQEEAASTERIIDMDAIKQKIQQAVEAGDITREQAEAKLEYLMQKIK